MFKLLTFVFLLFATTTAAAQVREITGLATYNNERITGALIKNLSTKVLTLSNDKGQFTLKAKASDTVTIAKAGFENDTLVIADQRYLVINLRKLSLTLKEVVINGSPISPESVYEANKKEYKEIYFLGDNSHIFFSGSLVNIDKLNNALGKKGHQARRMERNLTSDYKNSVIDKRFHPIAARITGYKDKNLTDFVENNRPTYEMVIKATDYDLSQYIKKKLAESGKK
jgi:hypothetical protein